MIGPIAIAVLLERSTRSSGWIASAHFSSPPRKAWINEIFSRARAAASPAVVIAAHGNPFVPNGPANGYTATVQALRDAARGFAGPVLFIHGDTHKRRLDQPFLRDAEDPVANFWRLEVFGYPDLLAMRVILDPAANPPVVTHTITTDKPLE